MTPILEVENLTLRFGMIAGAEGESLVLYSGQFVGIVGPNGAGKTTLLNLVTGYLRPQAGRVRFMGRDIVGLPPEQVTALGIGRSFQIPQLFLTLPVLENLLIVLATITGGDRDGWHPLHNSERLDAAHAILRQFGLAEHAGRVASELPEGARKLLDIALAFALRPRLLLLDEPTSGVSLEDKFAVMDTLTAVLRKSEVTTAFVEHDMDVVRRYADRVLALSDGRIIADGSPGVVLEDAEIKRTVGGWTGRADD